MIARLRPIAVVAALFTLAVGMALGGGPLSYVPDDTSSAGDRDEPDGQASGAPDAAAPSPGGGYGDAFATASAARLYGGGLTGHPTAGEFGIVAP